jgi:hypothetical protein
MKILIGIAKVIFLIFMTLILKESNILYIKIIVISGLKITQEILKNKKIVQIYIKILNVQTNHII